MLAWDCISTQCTIVTVVLLFVFLARIVRDYTSFAYAQQRSSAESPEPTEPQPAKKAATVTSASN